MELKFNAEDIIKAVGMHPLKVKNIYVYGSRVYGTARPESDWDIIIVGMNLNEHEEHRHTLEDGTLLNIHIYTTDRFKRDLEMHNMMNLECVFAPEWAVLQEKMDFGFELNKKRMVKTLLNASYNSWSGAKRKLNECDIYRGLKSVFHSLRILIFANQIAEHGNVVDFSEANYLYDEINECDEIDWDYFKREYLEFKIALEKKLKGSLE
jgi:predicted nucleotidyltransferase